MERSTAGGLWRPVHRFLSSSGLAVVVLLLLLLITFLGTIEQAKYGLYEVQKRYFESAFVVYWLFDAVPILLPGALLLLAVFAVNLLLGGFVKYVEAGFGPRGPYLRVPAAKIGVLVAHLGIVFLLVAGFLSLTLKTEGIVTLFEGEQADEYVDHYDWELAIWRDGREPTVVEHLVPGSALRGLGKGETRTFSSKDLPFDLVLQEHHRNCDPRPAGPRGDRGVDLNPLPLEKTAEMNVEGARLILVPRRGGEEREILLWGRQRAPATATLGGERFAFDLRKVRHSLPFAVRLEDFRMEQHPGTSMPSSFSSLVTRIQDGVEAEVLISMNKPLRHRGYTLYQSSWGPPGAAPGARLYSGLATVRNPAEQLPLYATIVVTLGLLVHFLIKLVRHLRAEAGRRS